MCLGNTGNRVLAGVLTGGTSEVARNVPGGEILFPTGGVANTLAEPVPTFKPPDVSIPEQEDFSAPARITGSGGAGSVGPGAKKNLQKTIKRNKAFRESQRGSSRPPVGRTGLQI